MIPILKTRSRVSRQEFIVAFVLRAEVDRQPVVLPGRKRGIEVSVVMPCLNERDAGDLHRQGAA